MLYVIIRSCQNLYVQIYIIIITITFKMNIQIYNIIAVRLVKGENITKTILIDKN